MGTTIVVGFTSTYGETYHYQLYAGRLLVARTVSTTQRQLTAWLVPSEYPVHLTVVAVAVEDVDTDLGNSLPIRPYNRIEQTVACSSWPADANSLELRLGTTPGGAVDDSNVHARALWNGDGDYTLRSDPLGPSGEFNAEIVGVDNALAGGNVGSALAFSGTVLAYPPDVPLQSDGSRFSVSVDSQQATVTFEIPD